ncbi:MAG: NAD(P)H-hydrate dehydratase [Opitutae bacterium]|nr:NAD(P)H-hydrate dehydratase [Opitutae bacterium]
MIIKNISSLIGKGVSPILNNAQAVDLEKKCLRSTDDEWSAMKQVGYKTSIEVLKDFQELKPVRENLTLLVLCGKGKNGGDSLLVADHIMRTMPRAKVVVLLVGSRDELHPLTEKALNEVEERVSVHEWSKKSSQSSLDVLIQNEFGEMGGIDICIDGLLGLGFKPPLKEEISQLVSLINKSENIKVRLSIDIPSGLSELLVEDELYFRSDFCYLAGIPKQAVFKKHSTISRLRYIDIGLMEDVNEKDYECDQYYLDNNCLDVLKKLRPANAEKRVFGHLFIVAGSALMPGALLMSVKAAIQSGAGLVTAFAPGSIVRSLSAQVPEAMWIALPETNFGTISAQASDIILSHAYHATAIIAGPGLGQSRDTEMVIQEILQKTNVPILLDADALVPRVLETLHKGKHGAKQIVLTPHLGEFLRMTKLANFSFNSKDLIKMMKNIGATVVLKGAMTRICDGEKIYFNTRGGPVFSRGGSGDILAGIIGAQLAQGYSDAAFASALGVLIHGNAGEYLARNRGQIMVRTTEVLDYLPQVIR